MSEVVRVESIAEFRAFRVALIKFVEACNVALGDAESDMQRTFTWLERDQLSFWSGQLSKRAEAVARAKEALRMKKLYKSPTGAQQSYVDEEKALRIAVRAHEEAEEKIKACKHWAKRLQKEIMMYKGGVTRFQSVLGGDIPQALAKLDAMASSLEAYASLASPAAGGSPAGAIGAYAPDSAAGSMSRAPDEAIASQSYEGLDIAALRESVPPADVRAAAPAADIREEPWLIPPIGIDARKAFISLDIPKEAAPAEGQTLVIVKGAWAAPVIFLERRDPAGPADTGWYLAPATAKPGIVALHTVPVRDLLEIRPDFRELLLSGNGNVIVLDRHGIRSVFTPNGDDLWSAHRPADSANPSATA
jgi:hypothetical protein